MSLARLEGPLLLPEDRRQSPAAAAIQRGVRRLYAGLGAVTMPELTLASWRRVDVTVLAPDGALTIVEIKSSVADFRADQKWQEYRDYCDHFLFAVAADFPVELLPEAAGLIVADAYGAAILREASHHPLAAARRKAMTLRFARAAAARLHQLFDPAGANGPMD